MPIRFAARRVEHLLLAGLLASCSGGGGGHQNPPASTGGTSGGLTGGAPGGGNGPGGGAPGGGAPGVTGGTSGTGGVAAGGEGPGGGSPGSTDGGGTTDGAAPGTGGSPVPAGSVVVATNRYDNSRSGWNAQETVLNTSNVNDASFGLLFSRPIMGAVYGHVLYVPGLTINGAKHNVIYVGTEHNMIYAYDADDPAANTPLWSKQVAPPLPLPIAGGYPKCADMKASGEVGVTSTPAISVEDGKLYLVSKTSGKQWLHALDLLTGAETAGSPAEIAGNGFNSDLHLNRPGLLLDKGTIWIGYSSHCDEMTYHGWVFAYDAKTLKQKAFINTTPTGSQGGLWMSGTGISADDKGVYFCVGNGTNGGNNIGFSVVRATVSDTAITIADKYFDSGAAGGSDLDLTAGVVLLGDTGLAVSGGKQGTIRLFDRGNLGTPKQSLDGNSGELHNFAFWNGSAGATVYAWGDQGGLASYKLTNGTLMESGRNTVRSTTGNRGHPGGIMSVSSNGAMPGTGIVWGIVAMGGDAWHGSATAQMFAFDAADVTKQLWTSGQTVGNLAKFSPAIVANGKVYMATFSGKINVFGLKK